MGEALRYRGQLARFGHVVRKAAKMREADLFTPEEMRLFREVDKQREHGQAEPIVAPPVPRSPIAPQHDLDAKHAADWDSFVQSHIQNQWDNVYSPAVSEALSEHTAKHLSGLRAEIAALRAELVQARLDISYLRGASDRDRGAEIIDLPALPSRRAKLNG
jgi:hypothetical protein